MGSGCFEWEPVMVEGWKAFKDGKPNSALSENSTFLANWQY